MSSFTPGSDRHDEVAAWPPDDLDAEGFGYWPQEAQDAILRRDAEIERLRDRAVCSGCGHDVGESGVCSYPDCDDGEMIPASDLPAALREMRDRRDEWRQEAMSL